MGVNPAEQALWTVDVDAGVVELEVLVVLDVRVINVDGAVVLELLLLEVVLATDDGVTRHW